MSAVCPLRPLTIGLLGSGAATRHPGRARRLAEAVFASLRLPCAARNSPVVLSLSKDAQLPPLAALTVVGPAQRVRSRSALRARAPNPALLGPCRPRRAQRPGSSPGTNSPPDCLCPGSASHARRALPGCLVAGPVVACGVEHSDSGPGKAAGGAWAGRIGAAEKRRVPGRARSALRALTCGRLFERSERSEFGHRPGTRASQGTRSEAKGKPSEPRPGPARHLARADASGRERTVANSRNGPIAAKQGEVDFTSGHRHRIAFHKGDSRVLVVGRTSPLAGHHQRAHRRLGRAEGAKHFALVWLDNALEHFAALA